MEPISEIELKKIVDGVVLRFYQRCLQDFLIGYYFQGKSDFFTKNIPRLQSFWFRDLAKSLGLNYAKQEFAIENLQLLRPHLPLNLKRGEIGRWSLLFQETLTDFPALPKSVLFVWKERIEFYRNLFLKRIKTTHQ
jgi:hypothetical protein